MCTEQIARDLDENQGVMILLDGKWGSGKTFRWEHSISKELKNKEALYFSLFGMSSLEDLKKEIFSNYVNSKIKFSFKHCISMLFSYILILILIINLVLLATQYTNQKLDDMQQLENSGIIFYIKQILTPFTANSIFWIVCAISLFIISLLWSQRQVIMIYFLNELMGINYNNVRINKLYSPQKTVFCFDDFERIAHTAAMDEFLGYFNSLSKTYKFNVLIIANNQIQNSIFNTQLKDVISKTGEEFAQNDSDSKDNFQQNYLVKYQEKLFDRIYIHEELNNFQEFLKNLKTNGVLQKFLEEIYEKLRIADEHPELYKEVERKFIRTASNNLRLIKKIKDNMDIVYRHASYEDLEKERNHIYIIKFVAGMTLGFEIGRYKKISDYCDKGEETYIYKHQNEKDKDFRDIFFEGFFYNYRSTYDLIYRGIISDNLEKELRPSKFYKYTEFEKLIDRLKEKHFLNYTSEELKDWLVKIDRCIDGKSSLFSSYSKMYPTLGTYCILLDYNGKQLISHRTRTKIERCIDDVIQKSDIFPYDERHPSYGWSVSGDTANDLKYLDNFIYEKLLQKELKKLKDSNKKLLDDFLEISNDDKKCVLDILSILIMSKQKDIYWENLYKEDYASFQLLMHKLLSFYFSIENYKNICKALKYPMSSYKILVNKLFKNIKKYGRTAQNYSSEYRNYEGTLNDFNKVKQQALYNLK